MQVNQQVYGQGEAANAPVHPLKPVIESLVKKENIDNYCTLKQIWQLITFPAKNSSGSDNLTTVLNNYCNNQLVMYEQDSKQLQIRPTELGNSVLAGKATAFYMLNIDGHPLRKLPVQRVADNQPVITDTHGIVVFENLVPGEELYCHQTFTTSKFVFKFTGQPCSTIMVPPKTDPLDTVINTGFYSIDAKEYTGKTVNITARQLSNSNENSILRRIIDVAPHVLSMQYQTGITRSYTGTVRSPNTLFGNPDMLVVVNGVPCLHPELINPYDVQFAIIAMDPITMSQYGSRAANGVILITLNKPSGAPFTVNHHSSIGITFRPQKFAQPSLTASEYLDHEISAFNNNAYDQRIANKELLSPVVELLRNHRDGKVRTSAKDSALAGFRSRDLQKSLLREWYRPSVNQQHFVSASSNLKQFSLYGSLGFDRILFPEKREEYTRKTLQLSGRYANRYFTYTANFSMAHADHADNHLNFPSKIPYLTLRDDSNNPVAIPYGIKDPYEETPDAGKYYSREFIPLTELAMLNHTYRNRQTALLHNIDIRLARGIEVTGFLQHGTYRSFEQNLHDSNSYFVRNTMNAHAKLENTVVQWAFPPGPINETVKTTTRFTDGRMQLNIKPFTGKNRLLLIAGAEFQRYKTTGESYTAYGYATAAQQITNSPGLDTTDNYAGIFSTANYTYDNIFTVSGSFRRDYLNAYGPKSLLAGPSFFSLGASIQLANLFQWSEAYPTAILRFNIGRSGTSTYRLHRNTTIKEGENTNVFGEPVSYITNTRNAQLAPEQLNMFDIGLDIHNARRTVRVSIDIYQREGRSLWSITKPHPATGIAEIPTNNNKLRGRGIDFYTSVQYGRPKWLQETVLWLSASANKVVSPVQPPDQVWKYMHPSLRIFQQGFPVHSLFAFRTAGLDSQTGDLQGYYKDKPTTNYHLIEQSNDQSSIRYMGSAVPKLYARLNHTLQLPYSLSLQLGIGGKFDYYYRRTSYTATGMIDGTNAHIDFLNRWQKPGDELLTNIPSFSTENIVARDFFNKNSDRLVTRADHIKFEYARVSWKKLQVGRIQELELGLLMRSNIMLWAKNDLGEDPAIDQDGVIIPSSFSLNINIKL